MTRRLLARGALECRVGALVALLASCATDRPNGPPGTDEPAEGLPRCVSTCVLAEGKSLAAAAVARTDSIAPIPLATLSVRGQAGTTVRLVVDAEEETQAILARDAVVWVQIDGGEFRALSFKAILAGAPVYTLARSGSVDIVYRMARTLPKDPISFKLVQTLSSGTVIQSKTPYGPRPRVALATQTSSCTITSPASSGCGVSYIVSPYVGGPGIGGTFTSDGGTGPSHPIHVSFSPGVQSVTVTIYDPTYAGNMAVAADAGGSLTANFAFTGQPGVNVPDTKTLIGTNITGLDLIPSTGIADGDYVAWDVSYTASPRIKVTCQPVTRGDQVTCTASGDTPNTQVTISEWRFESTDLTAPVIESSASLTWSGVAAVTGTVKVKGTVDGTQSDGNGPMTVNPRTWSQDTVAYQLTEISPSGLPPHPTRVGELGNHQAFAQAYVPTSGYQQVSSGPNTGVLFFIKVPVQALSQIRINRVALAVNSDFYLRQPKNNGGGKCTRADVMPFVPLAEAHEGLTLAPNSHAGVFRRELNARVPQPTESVVALNDLSLLQSKADQAAQPGITAAATISLDQINGGTVPPIPYCAFKFF